MAAQNEREFIPLGIAVLTISDTRNEETDKSGKLLVDRVVVERPRSARENHSPR